MSAFGEQRSPLDRPHDVLPASQYLQERLQERRAKNTRPKRARHTDIGLQKGRDDDIFLNEADDVRNVRMFDSSPLAPPSKTSDVGSGSRRRTLGVRDMDDQIDRLSKQNFALKLELDHRREQTTRMQEQIEAMRSQVERAEMLEDEHRELLKINSSLVDELEKRDKAVEEAMDIICDLEERVAEIDDRASNTRPSTANADSGYAGTETQEQAPPSSPPEAQPLPKTPRLAVRAPSQSAEAASERLQGVMDRQTPAKHKREPSFLSHKKPSTNALRSVYMASAQQLHPVKSFQSLLSKQGARVDEDGEDVLTSPRLSVLSESSFPSIYSPGKNASPDRFPWEDVAGDEPSASGDDTRVHLRQDSIKRVSQWISERDAAEATPSKSNSLSIPMLDGSQQAQRRDLHPQRNQSQKDKRTPVGSEYRQLPQRANGAQQMEERSRKQRPEQQPRPISFGGPIFGEPLLPPTPDSASTHMLRASRSSVAEDRSILDATPAVTRGYNALQAPMAPTEYGVRMAPKQMRSSVELRSAFASNLRHRAADLDASRGEGNADEAEDDAGDFAYDRDVHYDGFPDGNSILMGTPSRFLKHSKPPVANMMFDGNEAAQPTSAQAEPRRRRSSEQYVNCPPKPRLSRVETSPNVFGSIGKLVHGGKHSAESVTSPRSAHSGSSGNRTVVHSDERQTRDTPAEMPRTQSRLGGMTSPSRSRASPSPARILGQKAAGLIRRLSNNQGSDRDKPPPLPTLTSTPSSAYADVPPIEVRRPMTSHGNDRPPTTGATTAPRPPSAREGGGRPPTQMRNNTDPATGRPGSSAADSIREADAEQRALFKRSTGAKGPPPTSMPEPPGRNGQPKRRGSFRDAVNTARRPWR